MESSPEVLSKMFSPQLVLKNLLNTLSLRLHRTHFLMEKFTVRTHLFTQQVPHDNNFSSLKIFTTFYVVSAYQGGITNFQEHFVKHHGSLMGRSIWIPQSRSRFANIQSHSSMCKVSSIDWIMTILSSYGDIQFQIKVWQKILFIRVELRITIVNV